MSEPNNMVSLKGHTNGGTTEQIKQKLFVALEHISFEINLRLFISVENQQPFFLNQCCRIEINLIIFLTEIANKKLPSSPYETDLQGHNN